MDQQFLGALTKIIREELTKKHEVAVEGLGIFKPGHRKQFQQQFDDGRVVMMPPKDTILFVPEKKVADDSK